MQGFVFLSDVHRHPVFLSLVNGAKIDFLLKMTPLTFIFLTIGVINVGVFDHASVVLTTAHGLDFFECTLGLPLIQSFLDGAFVKTGLTRFPLESYTLTVFFSESPTTVMTCLL